MKTITNDDKTICVALKAFTPEEIDDIVFKLRRFRTKLSAERKRERLNEAKINQLIEQNNALDPTFKIERKKVKFTRPAKYRYIGSDGLEKTWAGVGRKPKEIQAAIDNGASLDDFLIDSND
jgi:DNA-binding protein H-NS